MEYLIDNSFIRDVKKAPISIQKQLQIVLDEIKSSDNISQLSKVKKLTGSKTAYRIKLDDYRIGFYIEKGTIVLSRFLARKDIYRYFPKK